MVNHAETEISPPWLKGEYRPSAGWGGGWSFHSSRVQKISPSQWGERAEGKTPTSPWKSQESFVSFQGSVTWWSERGGKGFPVRNQNPKPEQCEIQIYTVFKCGFPKPRNLTWKLWDSWGSGRNQCKTTVESIPRSQGTQRSHRPGKTWWSQAWGSQKRRPRKQAIPVKSPWDAVRAQGRARNFGKSPRKCTSLFSQQC